MKIYLLKYTEGGEEIVAVSGLGTHSKKSAAEITPTQKKVERMVNFAIEKKHSSLLDFPYYVLAMQGVSRSFTHQWVRYRHAAHLQQSLRYVEVVPGGFDWFVVPPSILKKGSNAIIDYVKNQEATGRFYNAYVDEDIPKEDARFGLPIGTKTHIASAFNAEEFLHIIKQRTCFDAQWEIRSVAYAILLAGMIVHPVIFTKAGPHCIQDNVCLGSQNGECKEDAEEIKKKLVEIKEEKQPTFENLAKGEELTIDLTDLLGHTVPRETKKEVWNHFGEKFPLDWEVELVLRKHWIPEVKEE